MLLRFLVTDGLRAHHSKLVRSIEGRALVFRSRGTGELMATLRAEPIDVVLALPADLGPDPAAALKGLAAAPRAPEVVLGTTDPDVTAWVASGATVLPRDLAVEAQLEILRNVELHARASRQLQAGRRAARLEPTLESFGRTSRTIRRFHEEVRRAAASDAPVLIRGEPGVGKGWLGPVLHRESPRARHSFQRICFTALEPEAIESELFGHAPGAEPGTTRAGRGLFERAHGGTLFLEYADQAPAEVQRRLAEVVDQRSIRPVGVEREVEVDVRLIASIHEGPARGVASPEMEPELRRRFELADLEVPPLRARTDDVPELADAFLATCRGRFGATVGGFSEAAMDALCRHTWPGNLSELSGVVERAALLTRDDRIKLEDLPAEVLTGQEKPVQGIYIDARWLGDTSDLPPLRDVRSQALDVIDVAYLDRLLRATGGRVGEAAGRAAVDPRSLYGLLRRHGLRKEDYRRRTRGG